MGKRALAAIGLIVWALAASCGDETEDRVKDDGPETRTERPYVRHEDENTRKSYTPYGEFMPETPPGIGRFVDILAEQTKLPKHGKAYPVDEATVARAAEAFVVAAREVFSVELSLDGDDAAQLDRLADAHLIDEKLRPYFSGEALRRDLSEEQYDAYMEAAEAVHLPNEPLLYYCMGCFWGELLVKHSQAKWVLYEPLNPIQAFPDMMSAYTTACMMPFSHVVKKFTDPDGDKLDLAALRAINRRYTPPYPLIASIVDANEAALSLLPPATRQGLEQQEAGNMKRAFELYAKAIAASPDNVGAYVLALQAAWERERWDEVEAWSLAALRIMPDHPVLNHNLAVFHSMREGGLPKAIELLEKALEADPGYARAHITIASCLLDLGQTGKATEHLEWVIEHDPGLKDEAERLLSATEQERTGQD